MRRVQAPSRGCGQLGINHLARAHHEREPAYGSVSHLRNRIQVNSQTAATISAATIRPITPTTRRIQAQTATMLPSFGVFRRHGPPGPAGGHPEKRVAPWIV